jgi:uncharacterized protein YggE
MRIVAIRLVMILALLAPATSARSQEPANPPPSVPTIVTSGEAVVQRVPDVGYVTLTVESRAKSPRDAQSANAEAMSAVRRQIATAGVPPGALRTIGLWLQQEFDNAGGRRIARDFVARNSIEVRIDDVARAGEIADAAVQGGATSLGGIRFDLKDRAAVEREALRLAVADARARAEAVAAGAGRTVDRILKIEDSQRDGGITRPILMRAELAPPTSVEPGFIEIRAHVALTASMK